MDDPFEEYLNRFQDNLNPAFISSQKLLRKCRQLPDHSQVSEGFSRRQSGPTTKTSPKLSIFENFIKNQQKLVKADKQKFFKQQDKLELEFKVQEKLNTVQFRNKFYMKLPKEQEMCPLNQMQTERKVKNQRSTWVELVQCIRRGDLECIPCLNYDYKFYYLFIVNESINHALQVNFLVIIHRSSSDPLLVAKLIRKVSKDSDSSSSEKRFSKLWSPEEDRLLLECYEQHQGNWKAISAQVVGRNNSQCQQRWKRINPNRPKLRKQWTDEEDNEVIRLAQIYGRNWKLIEQQMEGRTGKQIRERFLNNLDPEINRQKFTEEEDITILQQYRIFGPKWSEISKMLENRPENQVKNRFYSYIKRKHILKDDSDESEDIEEEFSYDSGKERQVQQNQCRIQILYNPLDTIPSIGLKEETENKNDSMLNIGAYNRTPSNKLYPSIHFIQDSFDSRGYIQEDLSPFNQQCRKVMDCSPINYENCPQSPNFDLIQEEIKELNNHIESISLDNKIN